MIIDTIKVLKPDEGMKLTDGNMIYDAVLLPKNRTKDEFTEITKEEAEERQKELELLEAINELEESSLKEVDEHGLA